MKMIGPCIALLAFAVGSGCAHKSIAKRSSDNDLASGTGWNTGSDDALNPCGVRVHFDYDSTEIPERDRPGDYELAPEKLEGPVGPSRRVP